MPGMFSDWKEFGLFAVVALFLNLMVLGFAVATVVFVLRLLGVL